MQERSGMKMVILMTIIVMFTKENSWNWLSPYYVPCVLLSAFLECSQPHRE